MNILLRFAELRARSLRGRFASVTLPGHEDEGQAALIDPALRLSRVLDDSVLGVSALTRMGVDFGPGHTDGGRRHERP